MRLDDDARVILGWEAELTVDPAGSTVELEVGETTYPMVWVGEGVLRRDVWVRRAQTVNMLRGTSAPADDESDIVLAAGVHQAEVIVTTLDGQRLPSQRFVIEVR